MKLKGNIESYSSNELKSYLTDTGSADAYAVALTPAIAAYTTGLKIIFQAANSNTGTSTLAVNGLAAKTIKKNVSTDLSANDIVANGIYQVMYDGTNFQMLGGVGGSGAQGFQGAQGHQGFQGAQGHQGFQGNQGNQGVGGAVLDLPFIIDGGGATIATGIKGDITFSYNCTINAVTMLADQTGSIVVDIWKDTYANFAPTDADSITASAVPTISSAIKSTDSTLTGWTTSISAGDILRFNVDSCTSIQRCTISLKVTRS